MTVVEFIRKYDNKELFTNEELCDCIHDGLHNGFYSCIGAYIEGNIKADSCTVYDYICVDERYFCIKWLRYKNGGWYHPVDQPYEVEQIDKNNPNSKESWRKI